MSLRLLFVFACLFFILYFETVSIGTFTISVLWKALLLLYFIIVSHRSLHALPLYLKLSFVYFVKCIFVYGLFVGYWDNISIAISYLFMPFLFWYLSHRLMGLEHKESVGKIDSLVKFFNFSLVFFAISQIPFIFGLQSIVDVRALTSLGSEKNAYIGFFQNSHAAAGLMAVSIVALLDAYHKRFFGIYPLIALSAICSYCLFQTYVRTGILMLIVGLVVYYRNYFFRRPIKSIFFASILGLIFWGYVGYDQLFFDRLFDNRTHGLYGDYRDYGSGRLWIWYESLGIYSDANFFVWLFGFGSSLSMKMLDAYAGFYLLSHNGFIDALVHNGVVGLFIFSSYLYMMYRYVGTYTGSIYFDLALSLFYMYAFFQLVQGGNQFLVIYVMGIIFFLLRFR